MKPIMLISYDSAAGLSFQLKRAINSVENIRHLFVYTSIILFWHISIWQSLFRKLIWFIKAIFQLQKLWNIKWDRNTTMHDEQITNFMKQSASREINRCSVGPENYLPLAFIILSTKAHQWTLPEVRLIQSTSSQIHFNTPVILPHPFMFSD
jgi:hypothetical protein